MAGLDHIRDRTDGILDRNGWAHTGRAVNVEIVDAEAFESIGQEIFNGLGTPIRAKITAIGIARCRRT